MSCIQMMIVAVCVFGSVSSQGLAEEPAQRVFVTTGGGADGVIEGEVAEASAEGVLVRFKREGSVARSVMIPWYEIRHWGSGGDEGEAWDVPAEFAEFARRAAIGFARRGRGDLQGCGAMYALLAPDLVGSDSAMAREVFGGLLEEAIVRGDFYNACVATVAMRSVGSGLGMIEGFDSRYQVHEGAALLPSLDGEKGSGLEGVVDSIVDQGSTGALILRAFDLVNSEASQGDAVIELLQELDEQRREDRDARLGLELYAMMLSAQRHPDAQTRREAREWLMTRSRTKTGTWIEAWCRLAAGQSYLNEGKNDGGGGGELVSRGVVELVHVMIRFEKDQPGLARWAKESASRGLRSVGRFDEAAELAGSFEVLTGQTE